ncbi:MAG: hypothetical protein ACPGO2_10760, partial [Pseudohongiellaceae bacterium]
PIVPTFTCTLFLSNFSFAMPDSLYLQTFDQCGLNLFLLARFIPDGVLLIFPYLFIPSGSDQFVPCVVRLLSSLH